METYFITIAGNIGVGKSTLVRLLTQRLGWEPVYEAVEENPYLADFYQDMRQWSFQSQVFFLSRRLRQHHSLLQLNKSVIQDRSVYEDAEIFARNLYDQGNMSERDWNCYFDLYRTLNDVVVGDDVALGVDDEAGAGALLKLLLTFEAGAATARDDVDRHDRRTNVVVDTGVSTFTVQLGGFKTDRLRRGHGPENRPLSSPRKNGCTYVKGKHGNHYDADSRQTLSGKLCHRLNFLTLHLI